MDITDAITERISTAENAIQYAKYTIENCPEGYLIEKKIRGKVRFYQKIHYKEKYISNCKDILQQLQKKGYCLKLKTTAEKEIKALKEAKSILEKAPNHQTVFPSIPQNRRNLISPFESSAVASIRNKIAKEMKYLELQSLNKKTIKKNINLITMNNERVRSKSELIIADRLKSAGIPYIYEGRFVFKDKTDIFEVWFPDFQMFNIKTGEQYYWEHFGIMDNPEYCASCQFKLETYAKQGIIIGKNLIITMESSTHTLNTEYIDCLINEFLK